MDTSIEKLELILEVADQIKENLFGYGFEDFRTNRKLKISITAKLLLIIESVEENSELLRDFIPVEKFDEIHNIRKKIISGMTGISEEYIWQLCKRDLILLCREIRKIFTNNP